MSLWKLPLPQAVFLGFLIPLSSTAIILRALEPRGELDTPHGRLAIGISVFQDLAVIPMMLSLPLLSGDGGTTTAESLLSFLKSMAFMGVIVVAGRAVFPRVLNLVARTRQRDLFVLAVLAVSMAMVWGASVAGLSLAIGAFLAGLVVAGSEFRHQALSDLIPFREVFASLFLISIGMMLDPRAIWTDPLPILWLLLVVLVGKFALMLLVGLLLKLPLRVAILAGLALAQVGEFAFVLLQGARGTGLIDSSSISSLSAVIALSMLVVPLLVTVSPHIAWGIGQVRWLHRFLDLNAMKAAEERVHSLQGHVIIAGYGITGQRMSEALKSRGIPFVIVDLSIANVKMATESGSLAYYGDVTSPEVLGQVSIRTAREFVVVVNDARATERAVRSARALAPGLHILARGRFELDRPLLEAAGADEVVTAETEAAEKVLHAVIAHVTAPAHERRTTDRRQ